MIIELLTIATLTYISGRGAATGADSILEFAESHPRTSTHRFANRVFSVDTNEDYRTFNDAVVAINGMVASVSATLASKRSGRLRTAYAWWME